MEKDIPAELISKYVRNNCTQEECALVESWHLKDLEESIYIPSKEIIEIAHKRTWDSLLSHVEYPKEEKKIRKLWPKIGLTASIVFIISITFYFSTITKNTTAPLLKKITINDVSPGNNKAILILNNGKKIILNDSSRGLIAVQGNVSISKAVGGKLIYHQSTKEKDFDTMNTLQTPMGGNYQVTLPDGTNVWLNAASTLSYPTIFKDNDRTVNLIGEAYFEVTKDSSRPFKVVTNSQTVEVLGTHFNIKAYLDDGRIHTTLLEGKIKLLKGLEHRILKPGQTALTEANSKSIRVEKADVEKDVAWKNNEFVFNGEDLISIMKTVSRWYNVEIIYKTIPNQAKYWGVISRSRNISEVLKMLQATGKINFKIQGRRITIMM